MLTILAIIPWALLLLCCGALMIRDPDFRSAVGLTSLVVLLSVYWGWSIVYLLRLLT